MTKQEIDTFLTVVKCGNISNAASALYISQPAVSNHIRLLEKKLGCPLFVRKRGVKQIELTPQGRDFVDVAERWRILFRESQEIANRKRNKTLHIASVGSVSSYILPQVMRTFLEDDPARMVTFHNYHSKEAYDYVEQGAVDLALISDAIQHPKVETILAFEEPMLLTVSSESILPAEVHPNDLDPSYELRLPWNPEYDAWHMIWFDESIQPRAVLDQMSVLEAFFSWNEGWSESWVLAPAIVSHELQVRQGTTTRVLRDGPPNERIYYIQNKHRRADLAQEFLSCLNYELSNYPLVKSYL